MVVICTNCDERIYDCPAVGRDYSGDQVRPEDFIPLVPGVSPPQEGDEMLCPLCHELYGHGSSKGGVVLKLEGGAWWPHPPFKD